MSCLVGVVPTRGRAYIRRVETEDTYRGGSIIVPDQAKDKIVRQQFTIVSLGDYAFCEDPEECNRPHFRGCMHEHRLQVGDWVVARNRSWLATPDPEVYVVWTDDVLGVFKEVDT